MANLEGLQSKFIGVLKMEDAQKHLTPAQQWDLIGMFETIDAGRQAEGKPAASNNVYLVINTDEPYADEVIEIMKRHGHWG